MDTDNEEYRELLAQWGLRQTEPVQESMRGRHKMPVNPSRDDLKVRRRNRRTAAETFDTGGDVQKRAELVRAYSKASSLAEQARLLDEIAKIDNARTAAVNQGRELDFEAARIVEQTLAPVRVHEFHTAATDWIGYEQILPADWQNRVIAEAAAWYSRVPNMVKADGEEYAIQAQGKARQISGQFGIQAQAAAQTFEQYAQFLRTQAASGLDQIQQTVDGNNAPKTTPLPTETFDNFAPEVDPINQGVSGTETSERAPLIQEIMNGGSGMNPGAPEKPGGHSTDDELSWDPPEGMQQDSAPGTGTPEKGGDRPDYGKKSSLIEAPSMAIGGYAYTLDDFRREAAKGRGQGKAEGGKRAASSVTASTNGCCNSCGTCKGGKTGSCCSSCTSCSACPTGKQGKEKTTEFAAKGSKEAASGLPMIQETVDANNQPHAPTPIPPEVAFPLDDEFQEEWTTNGTGNAQPAGHHVQTPPSGHQSARKQADMWGNSDDPHAVVQPDVANTPATTPPTAEQGGRAAGVADARANERPSFGDDSSNVSPAAQQYAEGYQSVDQTEGLPREEPSSVAGPGNAVTHAGSRTSSLIVTAAERAEPDFRKGYGYASRWTPGTVLVSTGSASFEAGLYAGISDNPGNQKAFVEAHRAAASKHVALGLRADQHKALTHRIAAKNEVGTNGLYLVASTSIDMNTMAPNTTPAADGSTPINGPGRPGPLDGQQQAAEPGGPAPYNGAEPFGAPVVPGANQTQAEHNPADALVGGGGMSTPQHLQTAFRRRVQSGLFASKQGK
jgi:hypothetical protein